MGYKKLEIKGLTLNAKELPILADVDVLIAGGGTAGAVAGIAAAREGARALVIERYGALGGSGSLAQVSPLMSLKIPDKPEPCSINGLIKRQMMKEGLAAVDQNGQDGWFNSAMLPFILDDLITSYGCDVLYDTTVIGAAMQDNELQGLVVQTRGGGKGLIRSRCVIDATGDALAAKLAGAKCFEGRESDGANQSVSLRFTLGGIDLAQLQSFLSDIGQSWGLGLPLLETASIWGESDTYPLERVFRQGMKNGLLHYEDGKFFQAFTIPGMGAAMTFNCPEIPDMKQALDPFKTSRAYVTGRKMTVRLHRFLKLMVPGFENSYFLSSGPMLGVRESRRVDAVFNLSVQDYLQCRKYDDGIAQTAYPIDIHGEEGVDYQEEDIPKGDFFEIPFRCLIPAGTGRLLVAGRCIGASFAAQSAARIQPVCRATGEAAGIGAAWLARKYKPSDDGKRSATAELIKGSDIRARMIAHGGIFLKR